MEDADLVLVEEVMSDTIYVYLLNEGTDVWRPVPSQHVSGDIYVLGQVEGVAVPDDEEWEFPPGTRVKVEKQSLAIGPSLVAVAQA